MAKKLLISTAAAVAWFLPGHLAIAALLLFFWGSAMVSTANTAKARITEARLAQHVTATAPAVNFVANGGTVGGSVTVQGNHTVTSSQTVQGNSTVNGSHTIGGDLYQNGPNSFVGGLTVAGSASVAGDHNVSGTATAYNTIATNGTTTGSLKLAGGLTMPNGSPGAAGSPPSGTGGAAAYAGNFYAGSGAYTWAAGVTNAINEIHSLLSNNGITN